MQAHPRPFSSRSTAQWSERVQLALLLAFVCPQVAFSQPAGIGHRGSQPAETEVDEALVRQIDPEVEKGAGQLAAQSGASQPSTPQGIKVEASSYKEREARQAFKRGIVLAKEESYREALVFFERAWSLVQRSSIAFNLATIRYKVGEFLGARAALSDFERVAPPEDPHRAQALQLKQQIEERLARLTVRVEPADAQLWVDEQAHRGAGGTYRLELDPGVHRLRAELEGYATTRSEITLEFGERRDLRLLPVAKAQASAVTKSEPSWSTTRWIGVSLAIGGGASLVLAGTTSLVALLKHKDSQADCEGNLCGSEGYDLRMTARRWGNVATATSLLGAALLAAGAIVYWAGDEQMGDEPSGTEVRQAWLEPLLSPTGIGLNLGGHL